MKKFLEHLFKFKFIYLVLLAIVIVSCCILGYAASIPSDTILKGIKVADIDLGGKTRAEALDILEKNIAAKSQGNIKIIADSKEINFDLKKINYAVNTQDLVEQAYNAGHIQSFGQKISSIFGGARFDTSISIENTFKKKPIKEAISKLKKSMKGPENKFSFDADYDTKILTLKTGEAYQDFDEEIALESICKQLSNVDFSDITIETSPAQPKQPDVDMLYEKLVANTGGNPTAEYKDGKINFISPRLGIELKKADFKKAYNSLYNSDKGSIEIPFKSKAPDVSLAWVKKNLFKDTLGACDNAFFSYNQTQRNRGINIRLACSKLNNLIINPGEVFSYNKIVGPRAKRTGFAIAGAYRDGQSTMEYGGGVCQTSSSLYRCALFADLEIIYRKNHTFTVSYVPLGEDATVSHPTVDFKFRNTTEWPIKIVAYTRGNHLYTKILGTMNPLHKKRVNLRSTVIRSDPAKTVTKYSSSLAKGKRVYENTSTHNGYVVDTFKTLYINGKQEYSKKITTSYYRRMDKVVVVGTGKNNKAKKKKN